MERRVHASPPSWNGHERESFGSGKLPFPATVVMHVVPAAAIFRMRTVAELAEVEVSRAVEFHPDRVGELRLERGVPLAVVALGKAAGERRDDAGRVIDPADARAMLARARPALAPLGDVHVAGGVERDADRLVERRGGGEAAVAEVVRRVAAFAVDRSREDAGAREGRDDAAREVDAPDAGAQVLDDVERLSRGVERDALRVEEVRERRGPPSPAEAGAPLPATVVIVPVAASTRRTRCSPVSAK
jgi:hypothetical protein